MLGKVRFVSIIFNKVLFLGFYWMLTHYGYGCDNYKTPATVKLFYVDRFIQSPVRLTALDCQLAARVQL